MIVFTTIFLGLVAGTQPVAFVVGDGVESVELRLDGEVVAVVRDEPWATTCDFGEEILPRRLVAVALDREGVEVGRVEQRINVPRALAEVDLVIADDEEEGPPLVRVRWESTSGAEPVGWTVLFDGQLLEVEDVRRFRLPEHDPERAHFLRIELEFPRGVTASAERPIGGRFGEVLSSQLTAVPVRVRGRRRDLDPDEVSVRVRDSDVTPEVVAVEKGGADVVAVIDQSVRDPLDEILERRRLFWRRQVRNPFRSGAATAVDPSVRHLAPLAPDVRLSFLWPIPRREDRTSFSMEVFSRSESLSPWDGGFVFHLLDTLPGRNGNRPPRLADAVGAAGLLAAEGGDPRAVVLLLGDDPRDASQLDPIRLRRFLARLGVPLVVWSVDPTAADARSRWGEIEDVSSLTRLEKAVGRLEDLLQRQRTVWVEGLYLPGEVIVSGERLVPLVGELVPTDPGIEEVVARWTSEDDLPPSGPEGPEAIGSRAPGDPPADPRIERLERLSRLVPEPGPVDRIGPWTLITDVEDDGLLAELARVGEGITETYRRRFGPEPPPLEGEVLALFAADETYLRFREGEAALEGIVAAGHASAGVAALAVGDRADRDVRSLVVHELTHLLNRRVFGRALPPWLEEGMAIDLEMSRISSDGTVEVGTLDPGTSSVAARMGDRVTVAVTGPVNTLKRLATLSRRGSQPSLRSLIGLTHRELMAASDRELLYATSGFFVRFLLDASDEVTRSRFLSLLDRLAANGLEEGTGVTPEDLGRHLGTEIGDLETGFWSWIRFRAATTSVLR